MEGDERAMLLDLLGSQISRYPDRKAGYDAFRALIERNIPDALESFASIISKVPAPRFPAAVALDIRTLINGRPATKSQLQSILDTLATTSTQAGRALQPARPRRG
jgi:hypothetical protein